MTKLAGVCIITERQGSGRKKKKKSNGIFKLLSLTNTDDTVSDTELTGVDNDCMDVKLLITINHYMLGHFLSLIKLMELQSGRSIKQWHWTAE